MNQPTVENLALFGTFTIHTDVVVHGVYDHERNAENKYHFQLN